MLVIKRNKIIEKWFYDKVFFLDIFKLVKYNQTSKENLFFVKAMDFYTIHIDLLKSESEIFDSFRKNTKYEINRAKKEGAKLFKLNLTIDEYCNLYNSFIKEKKLSFISKKELEYYWNNLVILGGGKAEDEIVVINSYLVDSKRARLFHSISLFRIDKNINKNFAGMVNRFLHFEAMSFFKSQGFEIYDLGGIGKKKSTQTIDKFKLSFSNNIVLEHHLVSPILYILLKFKGY
jgi:lipid II:glycine glycyltransferase (peptidoglycan interpeptide bridge formation enzyme)